jgi:hypothetical protein
VTTDGGFLTPEVLPEGDTNITTEEVATGDPTASIGSAGGVFPSIIAADDDVTVEEHGVILRHPMLRAPRNVSLDEAMGMAHWAHTQAQNVLHRESGGIIDEWQQHLDVREELLNRLQTTINSCDLDSQKMLADTK